MVAISINSFAISLKNKRASVVKLKPFYGLGVAGRVQNFGLGRIEKIPYHISL
jgi:hypothetical protein